MGESEFLRMFGNVTVSDVLIWVMAFGYIGTRFAKFYDWAKNNWRKTEKKEKAINNAGHLEEFHKQSVDIRTQLQNQIKELQKTVNEIIARLDNRDELDRVRRMNKTRAQIIQMYQIYASKEHNPMQAWTEMESDAFWKVFKDYEDDKGDGYVHTDIEPFMTTLKVVQMNDKDGILKLMQSRR